VPAHRGIALRILARSPPPPTGRRPSGRGWRPGLPDEFALRRGAARFRMVRLPAAFGGRAAGSPAGSARSRRLPCRVWGAGRRQPCRFGTGAAGCPAGRRNSARRPATLERWVGDASRRRGSLVKPPGAGSPDGREPPWRGPRCGQRRSRPTMPRGGPRSERDASRRRHGSTRGARHPRSADPPGAWPAAVALAWSCHASVS
jgi:hypothetical protein